MRLLLLICALLGCVSGLFGQQKAIPILERKISLSVTGDKLPVVLNKIAQQGSFSFSYNASLVQPDQNITLNIQDKSIREVLNQIFNGSVNYKEKSSHLILTKAPSASRKSTAMMTVSGYVEDEVTGKKIADASVYEKNSLTSAVTDEYGYYKIKLDPDGKRQTLQLSVSKANYRDTLVLVTANENQYINIAVRPLAADTFKNNVEAPDDSSARKNKEDLELPFESEANVRNIRDTLYRDIQISILPFVGSNGRLSGNIINDYSINFFGGYSLGTRRIELGFFFNADRGDVSFLQIAGFGNLVGGNVYGVQAAGLFNVTGGEVKAIQLAGLTNTNLGEVKGIQVAGIANINQRSADGILAAGGLNIVNGRSEGFQGAGLGNIQIGNYDGSQIAGLTNITIGKINGSQISALFNYARKVQGSQIGLINIADTLTGLPIGLVSYVHHGYHKLEFSTDEIFYANAGFRTGVHQFYNILNVGVKPENVFKNSETVWTFGYGVGTAPRITRWLSLNADLTSNQVNRKGFTTSLSLLNKFYLGFDVKLARKFSLAFGATLNGYLSNPNYADNPLLFTDHSPKIFYNHNYNSNVNLKMWFGGKIGLRFL